MRVPLFTWIGESMWKYPMLLVLILFCCWFAAYLIIPVEEYREIPAPRGEGDIIMFGDNTVLVQEFTAHRGISGIDIPLGSDTYPNNPLILHIRKAIDAEDIIVVPLFSFHDEYARFRFSPLWNVSGKLIWILEAPHAPPKSYWAYREQDASAFTEGQAFQNKRLIKGNLGFHEIWQSPRFALFGGRQNLLRDPVTDIERTGIIMGALSVAIILILRRVRLQEKTIVVGSIILGAVLHIWLGTSAPLIIDEGAYIQDVLQSSSGLLPFRDFLTKGPLYLFLLWLWSFIIPNTVIAWRLFSIIAWSVGGWWFWKLVSELRLRPRSRILASLAFNLIPAAIALTTPLLLQTVSVPVSIIGLVLALRAGRTGDKRLAILSAAFFTVAFFMRVTAIVPASIGLVVYFASAKPRVALRLATTYIATGILLFGIFFGAAVFMIGLQKAAVVVNLEALLISQNRQEHAAGEVMNSESLVRMLTIESRLLWRSGVPLLASICLLPLFFVNRRRILASAALLLGIFLFCATVIFNLYDTGFLLPGAFPTTVYIILALFLGIPAITAMAALLYDTSEGVEYTWVFWRTPLLVFLWLALTIIAYAKWGRFRQSYITEFLPQLVLLFAIGADYTFDLWQKIRPVWLSLFLRYGVLFLVLTSVWQGYGMAWSYPHSGTIDQPSLVNIVRMIESNVPKGEAIFTAQPVATAFANRRIMFGYAHPGWYREARFGTIPESLRDLLFRRPQVITDYLDTTVNFVLTESRTHEIYFDGYPERSDILSTKFEKIASTVNEMSGETYTLYRRR